MKFKNLLVIFVISLFTIIPAFAYFHEDYAKSSFYFFLADEATAKYKEIVKNKKVNKDSAFYFLSKEFEKFVFAMNYYNIDNISDLYCSSNNPYTVFEDKRSNKVKISEYSKHGFALRCSEAMSSFIVDYNWLETRYGKNISPEYKKWLSYLKNPVIIDDGGLITSKKLLSEQIKILEQIVNKHPDFVGIADVVSELEFLKKIQSGGLPLENPSE